VPVVVYVYPQGARAGSAGTFITAAANIAVMSPGTNIGAATPVTSSGRDVGETLANKVTNDAAALMRSIAQQRGRNQEKLEATVREAASFTATEAEQLGIVDFIAHDMDDLLTKLDGKEVQTATATQTLGTGGLQQRAVPKNLLEHFLEFISNPNVSFLLMTIGSLGILIEVLSPGLIVPGVVGAMCLLLAFLAWGNLPVNWIGVAFIALALILAALEVWVSGFGFLGIAAIVSLLIGGFLLFSQFGVPSPTLPAVSVNRWLLASVGGGLALALLYLVWVSFRSRRAEYEPSAVSSLVGSVGLVTLRLEPRGVVRVGGETWTAVSDDDTVIDAGTSVIVSSVDGLILTVFPENNS
jgi:membrane-bound serine protease (ClpP class)